MSVFYIKMFAIYVYIDVSGSWKTFRLEKLQYCIEYKYICVCVLMPSAWFEVKMKKFECEMINSILFSWFTQPFNPFC